MPGGNLCVLVAMQKVKDLSFKPVPYICLDRVLVTLTATERHPKAHVTSRDKRNGFEVSPNYVQQSQQHLGVSKNNGTPKSSILIGFSIIFTIHFGGKIPLFLVQHPLAFVASGRPYRHPMLSGRWSDDSLVCSRSPFPFLEPQTTIYKWMFGDFQPFPM